MIEPSMVNAVAKLREDENLKFRRFLKNRADGDVLDKQFLALHNELFSAYDCRKCNNCCREYRTTLQEDEIDSIAELLGLTVQAFLSTYHILTDRGYEMEAPCCFLAENGECGIQECKPRECRDFPHTDNPERLGSLLGIMSFAEVCPVFLSSEKPATGYK